MEKPTLEMLLKDYGDTELILSSTHGIGYDYYATLDNGFVLMIAYSGTKEITTEDIKSLTITLSEYVSMMTEVMPVIEPKVIIDECYPLITIEFKETE